MHKLAFAADSNAVQNRSSACALACVTLPLRGKITGSIIKVNIMFSGTVMGSLAHGSLSSLTVYK